jgi:methyl-accepting chemotaxis protein
MVVVPCARCASGAGARGENVARQQHRQPSGRWRSERGAVALTNGVVIAVVVVAGIVSVTLLARTARAANRINHKAENIAKTGQGINTATDSVIQLTRTNQTAGSILASAKPLEGKLNQVIGLAQSVDGLAKSINGTAGEINGTGKTINGTATAINGSAGKINGTAKTINGTAKAISGHATSINGSATAINATAGTINAQAAAILDVAKRINNDVAQINTNLDGTIGLAQAVKTDTGNILGEAKAAERYARCIDERIPPPGVPCSK